MARPVVIRSFLNPNDAHFAKLILEDAGIPVVLYDEHASGSTISYTFATGGIKVAVPDTYLEQAVEILEKDFQEYQDQTVEEVTDLECPKCGSKKIFRKHGYTSFGEMILFFLAGIFFMNKKKTKCQCRDCRHTWRSY
jgi:ssDNA-binding Zn-finger/Zn-ribbon topoisomerase 1